MISSIAIIIILIVIYTLLKDFIKNPAGSLINPLFTLLLFSVFYFILPLIYADYALEVSNIHASKEGVYSAYGWSLWYTFIFYIFYTKSPKHICELSDQKPSKLSYKCAFTIYWIITFILLFIIVKYTPAVYAARDNRAVALSLYEGTINAPFKLRILQYCHYVTIFILYLKKRNLTWLLPCICYFIIDYSHGGRTVSLMTLMFCYFIVILHTHKTYIMQVLIIVFVMIMVGTIQRSTSADFLWNLYTTGSEFSNTYLTTIYLTDHPNYLLDGWSYILVSLSKILPGGFVDKLLNFGEWYGNELSKSIGMGYGLAGNLITEALVYGGNLFSFFSPIFIGYICFIINNVKGRKKLFFFLYALLLSISMQNIVRSYFWGFILYPIQILCFYLIFLYNDFSRTILK